MEWYWVFVLLMINNYLWWNILVGYRKGVEKALRQTGKDHYADIREVQQLALQHVRQAELQAQANTYYEAADLLKGTPDAVAARKELLDRRNKVLEYINGTPTA